MGGWFSNPLEAVVGLATGGLSEARGRPPPPPPIRTTGSLLSGLPGIRPPAARDETFKPVDVGKPPKATDDKTPANAEDTKNFTVPSSVPTAFDSSITPGTDVSTRKPPDPVHTGRYEGPVTPELVTAAGFSKEEAADWANLANWITKGESRRDEGAFTELFNGDHWLGGDKTHPKGLGWAGDVYNGRPTSAYGLFQDEYDTWVNEIAPKYLGNDTRMTPVNQVKGNLLYAAAEYQRRTGGRNLLADFKAGQLTSVESNLHSIWPTLGEKGTAATGGRAGDAAFNEMLRLQGIDIKAGEEGLKAIIKLAQQADPLSDEMKRHLVRAMERSDQLAEQYQTLAAKPPQSRTPWEAASGITPLLIMLATLGGFASRRPALGAINALSGGLQGLREGNDLQYKNNMDLWKTQTDMAYTAFQMQNTSIRNIMDDINLTDREKQQKLTDAFRFWQMDQDIRLARENQWAEIYKRQDQREDKEWQRRHLIATTDAALRKERREEADEADDSAGLPPEIKSIYKDLYKLKKAEVGDRELTGLEILELKRQARERVHTKTYELTPPQQAKNDQIDAARKRLGADSWPKSFETDVERARMQGSEGVDDDDLTKKGYTKAQIELLRAVAKLSGDPVKSAELTKDYTIATTPKFRPRTVTLPESGVPPPEEGGAANLTADQLDANTLKALASGHSPAEVRDMYLELGYRFGKTQQDFDELLASAGLGPVETPTGPVVPTPSTGLGLPPSDANLPLGLQPQYYQP